MGWNTLFEEKAIPIVDQGGGMLGATIETVPLTAGNAYKIVWDGTPYTCIAAEANNGVAVGNLAAVGGAGNGEPFIIATFGTGGSTVGLRSQLIVLEGGAEHTVSISEYSETIHPMAPEFLPAGVGGNDREFIIDAIMDYHGQLTADKTYDEILAALQSGKVAIAYMTTPDGYRRKSAGWGESEEGIGFLFLSNTLDSLVTITCSPDNEWYSS